MEINQTCDYQNKEIMGKHFDKCDNIFKEPISRDDQTLKIREEVHEMVNKLMGRLIANIN